jgi:hypothetical protein
VKDLGARVIVSEIGTDMSRFATDAHLVFLGLPLPAQL